MSLEDRVEGLREHDLEASVQAVREKAGGHEEGVWANEYRVFRADMDPLANAAVSELTREIFERIRAQRLFTEAEVELAANRFDYQAAAVMEFAQLKASRNQAIEEGEEFDLPAEAAAVLSVDEEAAFVPTLPGTHSLTVQQALEQGVDHLEYDDDHPLGLFDPLQEDEPEYVDIGDEPLDPEYWQDTDEDKKSLQDQKRLVRTGFLRFNETKLAEDADEESELYTPGDFIRETLYGTNAKLLQEKIKRGVEAKLSSDAIIAQLQQEYPDQGIDFGQLVHEIEQAMSAGEHVGSWGVYKKVLEFYGRNHKIALATIGALSAASVASEVYAGKLTQDSVQTGTFKPELLLGGVTLAVLSQKVNQWRGYRTEKLLKEIALGNEDYQGVLLDTIRKVAMATPDLVALNRASMMIGNPRNIELQVQRLQRILSSIPAETMPAIVQTLVAGSYVARSGPNGAILAPALLHAASQIGVAAAQSRFETPLERKRQQLNVKVHGLFADLMGFGNKGFVNTEKFNGVLEESRDVAQEEARSRFYFGMAKLPSRPTMLATNTLLHLAGVDVNTDELLATSSAQGQVSDAIAGFVSSAVRTKPQLAEIASFLNEITLTNENQGTVVPDQFNLRLQGITRKGAQGEVYFSAEDVAVKRGGKYFLEGGSGQGKSQFLDILYTGAKEEGLLSVDGFRFGEIDRHAYQKSIGLKPQEVPTIEGNLGVNLGGVAFAEDSDLAAELLGRSALLRSLVPMDLDELDDTTRTHIAQNVLVEKHVGSTFSSDKTVELSGGQRQLLGLLRIQYQIAYAKRHPEHAPEVAMVLLDEPFAGLSAAMREEAESIILEWLDDPSLTVVFSNHESLDPESEFGKRIASLQKIRATKGYIEQA